MSQLHKIGGCDNAGRKLDVVFIHGLGGDAVKTWRHGADDSSSWPHWVGKEFSDVGIWSLEYAASPVKLERLKWLFGKGDRLTGHAMPLPRRASQVIDLMAQKGIGQRPLVLVGHSLGGLLAKQVLRDSADSDAGHRSHAISEQTRSVMFLGTPHAGSSLASILHRFRAVFGSTVAVEGLRAHDAHLENLYNWYRNKAPGLGITTVTYYETLGCGRDQLMIVDSSSAHPGVGHNPVGLDEDHLTLAKPRSRDAQVCDALRELIRGILNGAPPPPRLPVKPPPPAPPPVNVQVTVQAPAGAAVVVRVVYEFPPRAEQYFGRAAERERLAQRLRERRNTAVVGPGGLGKTALAAEALHGIGNALLKELYPEGSVYLDLYATRANRDAVWSRLANTVKGSSFLELAPPQTRAEEACRGRQMLLIIEGGEEADGQDGRAELVELLSVLSTETVRLLLTREVAQAASAESIRLREALGPDDAAALFDALSGGRLAGEGRSKLLELLAGHPLALTWAGNLLARDDEHPETLLQDWTTAVLPPLTDPTKSTHTLRWLYDRSARGLDTDTQTMLAAAGLLAHSPLPLALVEAALEGSDLPHRARGSMRALVGAGLMRIEPALPDHWQFAHVLAHRYARDRAATTESLALNLAASLQASLEADCVRAGEPAARARVARNLDHAAALLRSAPLAGDAGWRLLANPLLYDWQEQLLARGRSDLSRYALDAVEAWMAARPAAEAAQSDSLREHSVLHNQWGNLLVLQGDLPGARARYEAQLAIAQRLAEADPGNAGWQRDLSVSFNKLGDVQSAQGDLPGARARYEAGLAIAQRLAEADPGNAQWQRDLSVSFNKLGDVQSAQGDLPGARARYEAGLAIAQRLAEADPGNAGWQRDLSVSFNKLGDVQSAQGDLPGARARYEAQLAIAQRLAEADPGNAQWQRDLSVSFEKLGDVQSAQGDLPGARARYEAGLAIAQRLAEADPGNAGWQRDLSVSLMKLAVVDEKTGDIPGALRHAEASLAIDRRLAALDPSNFIFRSDVEVSRRQVERLRQQLGDND